MRGQNRAGRRAGAPGGLLLDMEGRSKAYDYSLIYLPDSPHPPDNLEGSADEYLEAPGPIPLFAFPTASHKRNVGAGGKEHQESDGDTEADGEDNREGSGVEGEVGGNKMGPKAKPAIKRDADFTALLSFQQRCELLNLIARITDNMQKTVVEPFEKPGDSDSNGEKAGFAKRQDHWAQLPGHLKDLGLTCPIKDQVLQSSRRKDGVSPRLTAATIVRHQGQLPPTAHPLNDDSRARLPELKKDVVANFKKWQLSVKSRLDDISIKKFGDGHAGHGNNPKSGASRKKKKQQHQGSTAPVEIDQGLLKFYPPLQTALIHLPVEKKTLLLHGLLLLLLSLEHYNGWSRVLLLNVTSSLRVPRRILVGEETRVAKALSQIAREIPADELLQLKKAEETRFLRRWKPPTTLPDPLLEADIGSLVGGPALGKAATAGIIGIMAESSLVVSSMFGLSGARKMVEQYVKDISDFAFIPVHGKTGEENGIGKIDPSGRRLRTVLAINGWLHSNEDVTNRWSIFGPQAEVYAVQWELDALGKMGNALNHMVMSSAWPNARQEVIARNTVATEDSASDPPDWPRSFHRIAKNVDNPFTVALVRAEKLGNILADILMNKSQGERGVTLIGYSLGARAIYACLMALAERRIFGLVENAVLMGAPVPSDIDCWCTMKSVVTNRLVNVYSENDFILGFLYRQCNNFMGLAGVEHIKDVKGVENVDVSAEISCHVRYHYLAGTVLRRIDWDDIDDDEAGKHESAMVVLEDKYREREQIRNEIELGIVLKPEPEVAQDEQPIIRTRMRKKKGSNRK